MKSIRIGNDFAFVWRIMRGDKIENLADVVDATLSYSAGTGADWMYLLEITPEGSVRVEMTPEIGNKLGVYNFVLKYIWPNSSFSDGDQKNTVDIDAFRIVPTTAQADEMTEVQGVTDILIGLRGKAFEYEDFTPEQIEGLQRPSIEAAQLANNAIDDITTRSNKAISDNNTATDTVLDVVTNIVDNVLPEMELVKQGAIDATQPAIDAGIEANKQALFAKRQGDRLAAYELMTSVVASEIEYNEITF